MDKPYTKKVSWKSTFTDDFANIRFHTNSGPQKVDFVKTQ